MRRVLAIADALRKDTLLTVRPIGQNSEEAVSNLVRYYENFGFMLLDRETRLAHMKRPAPNAP